MAWQAVTVMMMPTAAATGRSPVTRWRRHQPVVVQCSSSSTERRSANYPPSSWDYASLLSKLRPPNSHQQVDEFYTLKAGVKERLQVAAEKSQAAQLNLIDTIQRLGIAYHFEQEITHALSSIHSSSSSSISHNDAALRFRLLRQNGFPVSPSQPPVVILK